MPEHHEPEHHEPEHHEPEPAPRTEVPPSGNRAQRRAGHAASPSRPGATGKVRPVRVAPAGNPRQFSARRGG